MTEEFPLSRLRWATRRGMLELDLIMGPFFEQSYQQLSPSLKKDFQALLGCPDQLLFDWLVKKNPVTEPHLSAIVKVILDG